LFRYLPKQIQKVYYLQKPNKHMNIKPSDIAYWILIIIAIILLAMLFLKN